MVVAVGLTVGGWVASTVISKLINELTDYAKNQMNQQGLKDELARLEKALPKIQAVLNVVDQGLLREVNEPLEKWLWQLRDASDKADDVMDKMKYNSEKEKVEAVKSKVNKGITNVKKIILGDSFLKELKKVVKDIDAAAADVEKFYKLSIECGNQKEMDNKLASSNRETSSVINAATHVFGRKKEMEDIIKMVKSASNGCETSSVLNVETHVFCQEKEEDMLMGKNLAVLPIIGVSGVGGVGKTTLVQHVYNDPIVKEIFELKMWVCISNNFDLVLLTKKLYESVFKEKANSNTLEVIQNDLKTKLKDKKFLVVFDDVWYDKNADGWEKLIAPLTYGKSGSVMLLTTRESVPALIGTSLMDLVILKGLNEGDMWRLLKKWAFWDKDIQKHKELVDIGREIAKKLKGSPLAAKTVGEILRYDLNEKHWRNILESELWSLEQEQNGIMPALRLTYQYLPPHLKPCFSFCSIFPQDHVFRKNDLINMWIALGLVPWSVNGKMSPEDVGSKYFDDLVSKLIFTRPKYEFLSEDKFIMHGLIHDLSMHVSQGECFITSTDKSVFVPDTIRHLYAHIGGPGKLNISGLKNLRTLILHFDESHHSNQDLVVTEMLKGMKSLRLLVLFAHNLSEFPEGATELLHLRYLSLTSSRISAFAKSMSRLYLLETMVYKDFGAKQLKQAYALGMLNNLRHLIAPKYLFDKIPGVGRLTSLQELSCSVGKDSGFKICALSDMIELRSLEIDRIENVGSREEVIQANLRNKVNLNELSLAWNVIEHEHDEEKPAKQPNKEANEDVLDHLEPHPGLKKLTIKSYEGTGRPPKWFRTQVLSMLVCLELSGCNFVHLNYLEELPLLKDLIFHDMNAIKRIVHECSRESAIDAFPSLERLSVDLMGEIEQWFLAKQPNKWMQCLQIFDVSYCPKLQRLPPIPVNVKEVKLANLGLNALPNLWNDQSSNSALEVCSNVVVMSISSCENIVSLTEGLFQKPERFVSLEKLEIEFCCELLNLPHGGFSKFHSLKELRICNCQKIGKLLVQEECFLPSKLQKLRISHCGHLDTTLPKALESVHSLIQLDLRDCENITSLPSKEVFSRWKTLKTLFLIDCPELASLESLLGLSSIKYLQVVRCPMLSRAIPSPLPLKEYETERKEEGTTQTSDRNDEFNHNHQVQPHSPSPSSTMGMGKTFAQKKPLSVDQLVIDDPWLLSVQPIRSSTVRKLIVQNCSDCSKLKRSVSAQPQPLSVDELVIDDPLLVSVEPIRSLSSVKKLIIKNCSELQSLPEHPPVLQELYIEKCSLELWRRCKKSGPDWSKLSQIPKVTICDDPWIKLSMDDEYDVIVLGTGLKECILSGLLSVDKLKVLHMDRNNYYGGESTSLNLTQLRERFRGDDELPDHLNLSKGTYVVDMIPKFMMANGTLVRVLIHTGVAKYLSFKAVDGSYVLNKGKVHKVPATEMEACKSPLIEKRRAHKFFINVQNYDESDPKTHTDLARVTTKKLFSKYDLDDNTIDFIGHALALHRDDCYLHEPALDTVKRVKLYAESLARLKGGSPYIYPWSGLQELPEAFARLSGVYGGKYWLNVPECKVEFDMEGKACGVTSAGGSTFKCKKVVCDPSYLPNKVRKVGKVARAIAIMSHPIPNTDESHSVQIILPQKQLGRESDMYIVCFSHLHGMVPKGKFIAFVSCEAETDNPKLELKPGVDLLGRVDEIFFETYDRYEPYNDPTLDNCFITTSYDATTHFETTETDVLSMYTSITGKTLNLTVDLSKLVPGEFYYHYLCHYNVQEGSVDECCIT